MARVYWCLLVAGSLLFGGAFMHDGFPRQSVALERQYTCAATDQVRLPG
ncbi:MAG: hypothetical protein ACREVN_09310 [Gammaproteobacteria bacterium]